MQRNLAVVLCCIFALASHSEGLTTFRRGDKVAESFKELNLPSEEIDPNVGPTIPSDIVEISENINQELDANADEIGNNNEVVDSVHEPDTDESVASEVVTSTAAASVDEVTPIKNEDDQSQINKYCKCTDSHCDCCRNFALPIIPVRGPGCAKITYLGNEKMSVSIKYGDIVLATRTISGKNTKPICVGLPGGFSKFCGRVYGLSKAKEDFKACLGFELRAEDEVEASLRVSCFKFGPQGLRVSEAEPLPSETEKDEEDDDDDIFGFGGGGTDDDYAEDNEGDDEDDEDDDDTDDEDDEDGDDDDADEPANDDVDYGGFSFLGSGLLDELAESGEISTSVTQSTRKEDRKDLAQSKNDKGTAETSETVPLSDAITAPSTDATVSTTSTGTNSIKSKKTKIAKKNKKKKASESDYAFDIINGILDFFN